MLIPNLTQPSPAYIAGQEAYIRRALEGVAPSLTIYLVDETAYNEFWSGYETERLDYVEVVHA